MIIDKNLTEIRALKSCENSRPWVSTGPEAPGLHYVHLTKVCLVYVPVHVCKKCTYVCMFILAKPSRCMYMYYPGCINSQLWLRSDPKVNTECYSWKIPNFG